VLDVVEEPVKTLESLQHEILEYDPKLLELPALIALNKIDLVEVTDIELSSAALTHFGLPIIPVSAQGNINIDDLKIALFSMLPARPKLEAQIMPKEVTADPVRIEREGQLWVVKGKELEGIVARFDTKNPEAVSYLQQYFAGLGVNKMLKRKGAQDGEEVQIGGAIFDYFDEEKANREAKKDEE
jgi:GTP-binding protein